MTRFLPLVAGLAACSSPSSERVYLLAELHPEQYTLGIPVIGEGKLVVSRSLLEPADWSTVRGHATFTCDGCTLGDDRTRLRDYPWASPEGIEFGHITFERVDAHAEFADGKLRALSQWRSQDFELDARVDGTLATNHDDIRLNGCIKFRPTAVLLARDPRMHALVSITGAEQDDAGWFNIVIEGRIAELRRIARTCEL